MEAEESKTCECEGCGHEALYTCKGHLQNICKECAYNIHFECIKDKISLNTSKEDTEITEPKLKMTSLGVSYNDQNIKIKDEVLLNENIDDTHKTIPSSNQNKDDGISIKLIFQSLFWFAALMIFYFLSDKGIDERANVSFANKDITESINNQLSLLISENNELKESISLLSKENQTCFEELSRLKMKLPINDSTYNLEYEESNILRY